MSEASKRGKSFERELASIIRKKTGVLAVRDNKSGALWNRRSDIFTDLPIHIEAKDHETLKVKEWFRQADAAASYAEVAVLAFRCDEFILATLEFSKLVDLYVEIADLRAQVEDLRQPTTIPIKIDPDMPDDQVEFRGSKERIVLRNVKTDPARKITENLDRIVKNKQEKGAVKVDKNGHITDDYGYCQQKGCPYSRGYVKKKTKK